MGIWSPQAYDHLLLSKLKTLLSNSLNSNQRPASSITTYEQFVLDLDVQDKGTIKAIDSLLHETIVRRPRFRRPFPTGEYPSSSQLERNSHHHAHQGSLASISGEALPRVIHSRRVIRSEGQREEPALELERRSRAGARRRRRRGDLTNDEDEDDEEGESEDEDVEDEERERQEETGRFTITQLRLINRQRANARDSLQRRRSDLSRATRLGESERVGSERDDDDDSDDSDDDDSDSQGVNDDQDRRNERRASTPYDDLRPQAPYTFSFPHQIVWESLFSEGPSCPAEISRMDFATFFQAMKEELIRVGNWEGRGLVGATNVNQVVSILKEEDRGFSERLTNAINSQLSEGRFSPPIPQQERPELQLLDDDNVEGIEQEGQDESSRLSSSLIGSVQRFFEDLPTLTTSTTTSRSVPNHEFDSFTRDRRMRARLQLDETSRDSPDTTSSVSTPNNEVNFSTNNESSSSSSSSTMTTTTTTNTSQAASPHAVCPPITSTTIIEERRRRLNRPMTSAQIAEAAAQVRRSSARRAD